MTTTTIIYVTAGAQQYVGGTVTETTGKDISADTCMIGLSGSQNVPPTTWVAPSVNTAGSTVASRVLKLLITSTTTPGTYYCWAQITDSPEVAPLVIQGPIVVI
jgi:hypothetical protein